jgi:hypothetical protein
LWHAAKAVKKSVSKVSEGISWSQQLADKVEQIATHISWSLRNCDENPQKFKESLDNVIEHYTALAACHKSLICCELCFLHKFVDCYISVV